MMKILVEFVGHIRDQHNCCGKAMGSVESESNIANTHSPIFALDLASIRKLNMSSKVGGRLEYNVCRSTFLFYDRLSRVALAKLDEDPNRLAEMADVLLAIRLLVSYVMHASSPRGLPYADGHS